jgi:hypothetical protein
LNTNQTVPQILLMMVDLEDDPDWSVQDEIDDEDEDRLAVSPVLFDFV